MRKVCATGFVYSQWDSCPTKTSYETKQTQIYKSLLLNTAWNLEITGSSSWNTYTRPWNSCSCLWNTWMSLKHTHIRPSESHIRASETHIRVSATPVFLKQQQRNNLYIYICMSLRHTEVFLKHIDVIPKRICFWETQICDTYVFHHKHIHVYQKYIMLSSNLKGEYTNAISLPWYGKGSTPNLRLTVA